MPEYEVIVQIAAPSAAEAIKSVSWALYHHDGTDNWTVSSATPATPEGNVDA